MNTQRQAPASATTSGPEQGVHPSPHRDRVSPWAMWFCILGAPVAWSVQQLVNAPLFAHGCYPKDAPLASPIWTNAGGVALSVELIAMVVLVRVVPRLTPLGPPSTDRRTAA
jgi:hypothetical protein